MGAAARADAAAFQADKSRVVEPVLWFSVRRREVDMVQHTMHWSLPESDSAHHSLYNAPPDDPTRREIPPRL